MTPRRSCLLVVCLLVGLVGCVVAVKSAQLLDDTPENIRVKRQSSGGQQTRPTGSVGVNSPGGAQATASSLASASVLGGGQPGGGGGGNSPAGLPSPQVAVNRPKRPKVSASVADTDVDAGLTLEDDDRPIRVKPTKKKINKKRPINRRPQAEFAHDEYEEDGRADDDYEDCHDGDYDYGHGFHEAALAPMEHIGRMMNDFPSDGNAAVATSTNNGDGYWRTSSVVSNNGRTRGIVTETRNGRTRTRRINSDDDDEE